MFYFTYSHGLTRLAKDLPVESSQLRVDRHFILALFIAFFYLYYLRGFIRRPRDDAHIDFID